MKKVISLFLSLAMLLAIISDYDTIMAKPFKKLVPASSRPYANLYTPN